jgi:hypothetical protein
MSNAIRFYLDGMMTFGKLSQKEQIWVFVNKPEFVPAGSMLFFMAQ